MGFVCRVLWILKALWTGASEGSEETKHWGGGGKPLFVNNGLPLQCFVCSEPSDDAPACELFYLKPSIFWEICKIQNFSGGGGGGGGARIIPCTNSL